MNAKSVKDDDYVCLVCKQPLTPTTNGLFCQRDGVEYPVKNGIIDFVTEDLTKSTNPVLRSVDKVDKFAKFYEDPWYVILDKINAELDIPSMEEMAKTLIEMVHAKDGLGLDVPCGTGFFTRPLAQKMRLVYGIDISMGMLEQATEYAREKGIRNIRFAHSRAEKLPFPDGVFDGVTCSGALHLFSDTVEALSEMARVMKTGARLAVLTFLKQGLFTLEMMQDPSTIKMFLEQDPSTIKMFLERVGGSTLLTKEILETLRIGEEALHLFDVEELDTYLTQAGFKGFAYNIYESSYILFHAEKG